MGGRDGALFSTVGVISEAHYFRWQFMHGAPFHVLNLLTEVMPGNLEDGKQVFRALISIQRRLAA